MAELVEQNYRADVSVIDEHNFSSTRQVLTKETWLCTAGYDATGVQIVLSSGIDAVNANTPVSVSSSDVTLPVTGNVRV